MKNYTKNNHLIFILIIVFLVTLYVALHKPKNDVIDSDISSSAIIDKDTIETTRNDTILASSNKYSNALIALSKEHRDVSIILENIDDYPDALLELVLRNPETIDFVIDYLNSNRTRDWEENIDVNGEYVEGNIPLFLQWDKRWGYFDYGEDIIALNGCGPTSLSMVIVGLTGDTKQNPKVVADFSYDEGYYNEEWGTSWTLMSEGATAIGLVSRELPLSEKAIRTAIESGEPIIASMGKGDFTTTGHYIVLTGITDEGKVLVNDSNSIKRSNMEWNMDVFMSQTRNLWAFSTKQE